MIAYLKYLCKKRIPFLVALTVVASVICFTTTASTTLFYEYHTYEDGGISIARVVNDTPLLVFSIVICCMCAIVPMFEFAFKMNKLSCDQVYALPIKRWQLYLCRFITGYACIMIAFTVAYFLSIFNIAVRENYYEMKYFFGYYPLILLCALPIYAIVAFIFCEANSVVDGIIMVAFYSCIGMIFACDLMVFGAVDGLEIFEYSLYQPANYITTIFQHKLSGNPIASLSDYSSFVAGFVIYMVLGYALMIGFPFRTMLYRSEDTMQKSESFLSYRVLIPFGAISLAINNTQSFIPFAFAVVGTYLGYALYRRSFKLDKKHWIIVGGLITIVIVGSCITGIIL